MHAEQIHGMEFAFEVGRCKLGNLFADPEIFEEILLFVKELS